MKLRSEHPHIKDEDERRATEELRALIAQQAGDTPPADAYWSNQLVRSNQRIDAATSGRALSISWAARVAIPGIVAILSFFIGLKYYYVPDQPKHDGSLAAVVRSASDDVVDSLASRSLSVEELASISPDLLDPTTEQLYEYFLTTGGTNSVLDGLSNDQVSDILGKLGSQQGAI